MNKQGFKYLLERAVSGNPDAIMELLEMYNPLVNNSSIVYGYIDEDCRQYIQLRMIIAIQKFKIDKFN